MLQKIQTEIEQEKKTEEDEHKKFICYCDKNKKESKDRASASETTVSGLGSAIEEQASQMSANAENLKELKEELQSNTESLNEAVAARDKEVADFNIDHDDLSANIGALKKAIPALESKLANPAALISKLTSKYHLIATSFLSLRSSVKSNGSSEVLGILKQMLDNFVEDKSQLETQEDKNMKNFEALVAQKEKIIADLKNEIGVKTQKGADLKTAHTANVEDLEDANQAMEANAKFAGQLGKNCDTAAEDHKKVQADRDAELQAIGETIKMLNKDDSLDLFNKSLKKKDSEAASFLSEFARSLSFVQIRQHSNNQQNEAPAPVRVNVQPIINILDDNLAELMKQHKDEEEQKNHCETQLAKLKETISSSTSNMETAKSKHSEILDNTQKVIDHIDKCHSDIESFNGNIKESTDARNEANGIYQKESTERSETVELLRKAIDRLSNFYGTLGSEETVDSSPTTGLLDLDPPKNREIEHERKNVASFNVITLLTKLIKDVEKDQADSDKMENDSVDEFNKLISDLNEDISARQESITTGTANKAEFDESANNLQEKMESLQDAIDEATKQTETLKDSCKYVTDDYERRVADREQEMKNIKAAKGVLRSAVSSPKL